MTAPLTTPLVDKVGRLIDEIQGAITDGATGLAKRARDVAAAGGIGSVRTNYTMRPWALTGGLQKTSPPELSVRVARWRPGAGMGGGKRDSSADVEIAYAFAGATAQEVEDNISVTATALWVVLNGLEVYSAAHRGNLTEVVEGSINFELGDFDEARSTSGWICRFTVRERS